MTNFTLDLFASTINPSNRLSPGIHQGVRLVDIQFNEGVVDVTFASFQEEKAVAKLWEPKGSFPKPGEDKEQAVAREQEANAKVLFKILHILKGDAAKDFVNSNSQLEYQEWVAKICKLIFDSKNEALFNLKIGQDDSGYSRISTKVPSFIEKFENGVPCKLKFSAWEIANGVAPGSSKADKPTDKSVDNLV